MKDYISEKIKNHNHQLNQKQQVERMIGEHNIEKRKLKRKLSHWKVNSFLKQHLKRKKNIISKNRIT